MYALVSINFVDVVIGIMGHCVNGTRQFQKRKQLDGGHLVYIPSYPKSWQHIGDTGVINFHGR